VGVCILVKVLKNYKNIHKLSFLGCCLGPITSVNAIYSMLNDKTSDDFPFYVICCILLGLNIGIYKNNTLIIVYQKV